MGPLHQGSPHVTANGMALARCVCRQAVAGCSRQTGMALEVRTQAGSSRQAAALCCHPLMPACT